jgi:hypothetical protein
MTNLSAITICSINYISKALVLFQSYKTHNKNHDFYILLVDRKCEINFDINGINILWAEDLKIDNFLQHAFEYDVIEFNTNVKPTALKFLLETYDSVVYLDPDIKIYSSLSSVFDSLSTASVVVTPHANTPIIDGKKPDDLELLKFGSFNLGFVGVSRCEEGLAFLNWWSDRCLDYGFYEPQLGLAVDQKWVSLAPCFFPNLQILHDQGLNVAFWNLHERNLSKSGDTWLVNDSVPLKFIHFSSFNTNSPDSIAQKQTRFPAGSRPDFIGLAEIYAQELLENASDEFSKHPYGFDYFEDGTYITPALRRFYSSLKNTAFISVNNPFTADGDVKRFAKKNGLLIKGNKKSKRHIFRDMSSYSLQISIILKALRLALLLLGPERYFNLMRYLAHISSLRNQGSMFSKVD